MFDCELVLKDLSDFQDSVVLVGGWVPYVYMRYLWGQEMPNVRMTKDIDIGIRAGRAYKKRIQDVLGQKGYPMKHVEMGLLKPYQFVLRLGNQDFRIDFLGDSTEAKEIHEKVLGENAILNTFDDFNFVLTDLLAIKTGWGEIHVPKPERYLVYKAKAFLNDPAKRQRDITMVYFCFSRCRKRDDLENGLNILSKENLTNKMVGDLKPLFRHKDSRAVLDIRRSLAAFGFYDLAEEIHREMVKFVQCCKPR